jgi:L-lactate dehydrogenase complex protein LldE
MADDRLDEWTASGVQTVVGGDLSCLVHLEGRARRRALPLRFRHLAEVLRPASDATARP